MAHPPSPLLQSSILSIPTLNPQSFRRSNFWMPWTCGDERHAYELCQYAGYKRRLLKQEYEKSKHHHTHKVEAHSAADDKQ